MRLLNPRCARQCILVVLCALSLSVARAQAPNPVASPTYRNAIVRGKVVVDSLMKVSKTPGVSVAVGVDGQIVWSEGFGYADLEHRVPVTTATRMRIGSVSKVVTAAVLGKMIEQGRVNLDVPVQRYVPAFPEKRWPVTTRQLAGHQSGIRHYRNDAEVALNKHYNSVGEALEVFRDDSLLFEPGTALSYSTHAWTLVSAVVEATCGTDFLACTQTNVLDPLGLKVMTPEYQDSLILDRTDYYHVDGGGHLVNAPEVDNSWKWAGGGFISNTEDLVRFGSAHLKPGFLNEATFKMMMTSQKTKKGEPTPFGIGWMTFPEPLDGHLVVGHSGGSVGGTAMLILVPDQKLVVAVLGNLSSAPTTQIAAQVAQAFMRELSVVSSQ